VCVAAPAVHRHARTVELALGLIDRFRLGQDLPGDLPKVPIRAPARVPRQPRSINSDDVRLHQPSLITQAENLSEQLTQRGLVPVNEPGDRRVIRLLKHRDHPARDILPARALDRPSGPHAT
jgi:hypothetical protein